MNTDEPGAKKITSYRLKGETLNKIKALQKVFGESRAEVVERAVNLLDRDRQREIDHERERRITASKA